MISHYSLFTTVRFVVSVSDNCAFGKPAAQLWPAQCKQCVYKSTDHGSNVFNSSNEFARVDETLVIYVWRRHFLGFLSYRENDLALLKIFNIFCCAQLKMNTTFSMLFCANNSVIILAHMCKHLCWTSMSRRTSVTNIFLISSYKPLENYKNINSSPSHCRTARLWHTKRPTKAI